MAALLLRLHRNNIHLLTGLIGSLIDASSLRGGFFIYSSTCYSVCKILVGELEDAFEKRKKDKSTTFT